MYVLESFISYTVWVYLWDMIVKASWNVELETSNSEEA